MPGCTLSNNYVYARVCGVCMCVGVCVGVCGCVCVWVSGCVGGYLYMCTDVTTVGDNKRFTFHIRTIVVRTKNLCSVLRNFSISDSAIIAVPSM